MSEASHVNSSVTAESRLHVYISRYNPVVADFTDYLLSTFATILSVMLLGIQIGSYIFFVFC